ncbi:unnamed protein product [Gongylonema pulchrum]|uniref:Fibronectin type-III domain-containing protein n=1 Tax=Gongylonema pulchrum TaxID=637853 RepID=A0A183DEV2_9BILA|nr:unnamed protein product [Gongylonema pulchrum]
MGPQPGTLLVSWTPVSTQPLPPSRAAVHSYLVYADGRNIAQVPSASGLFLSNVIKIAEINQAIGVNIQ